MLDTSLALRGGGLASPSEQEDYETITAQDAVPDAVSAAAPAALVAVVEAIYTAVCKRGAAMHVEVRWGCSMH